MDPYRTLGVPRNCTREEAGAAFRARVASVHPDRGGDDAAFIQLRAAYKLILAELNRRRRPMTERPAPAARNNGAAGLREAEDASFRRRQATRSAAAQARRDPSDPDVVEIYNDLLDRITSFAEHWTPRTQATLRRLVAGVILVAPILCMSFLIRHLIATNRPLEPGEDHPLDWSALLSIGLLFPSIISVVVNIAWISEELDERDRLRRSAKSKDAEPKHKTNLFDEF